MIFCNTTSIFEIFLHPRAPKENYCYICNMDIEIRHNNPEPPYKQIVSRIEYLAASGKLPADTQLPSLAELSEQLDVSPETIKKSYALLKSKGKVYAKQGVGYFISGATRSKSRILMIIDRLDSYKAQIQRGLSDTIQKEGDITIRLHNQDVDAFVDILDATLGSYDWYIVAPHFSLDRNKTAKLISALSRIPAGRLIIIDRKISDLKGNYGEIVQDFSNDAAKTLAEMRNRLTHYSRAIILSPAGGLYCKEIREGLVQMFDQMGMTVQTAVRYDSSMMGLGVVFIVLGRTSGEIPFSILRDCDRMGLKLGVAIGLVTYNDEATNEFICGGISCLTSDFYKMGCLAGEMISTGAVSKVHNPFSIKLRNSL